MSRPQWYVATSNGAFYLKTSFNFVLFVETSFIALLVDPRRDIRVTSRPQCGVAIEDSTLNIFFSLDHTSFVATSLICCLGHFGCKLNFQVTTSLAKVVYFFLKIDFGDVMTWK